MKPDKTLITLQESPKMIKVDLVAIAGNLELDLLSRRFFLAEQHQLWQHALVQPESFTKVVVFGMAVTPDPDLGDQDLWLLGEFLGKDAEGLVLWILAWVKGVELDQGEGERFDGFVEAVAVQDHDSRIHFGVAP